MQHLCATNDRNGNPRRLWAVYTNDGHVIEVIDEGYAGRPQVGADVVELPMVHITPAEYSAWLGWWADNVSWDGGPTHG